MAVTRTLGNDSADIENFPNEHEVLSDRSSINGMNMISIKKDNVFPDPDVKTKRISNANSGMKLINKFESEGQPRRSKARVAPAPLFSPKVQ